MAEIKGDFTYSVDEERDNQYRFKGDKNEITMNRIYDEEWICDYHMRYILLRAKKCHLNVFIHIVGILLTLKLATCI